MLYAQMDESISAYRQNQRIFEGLNHNLFVGENQFYNTGNLTFAHFPVLSPRPLRGRVRSFENCHGLHGKDGLMWIEGNTLYHKGQTVGTLSPGEKQFVTMGSRVIIWPDQVMYETETGRITPLGASVSLTGATFSLSRIDGEEYGSIPAQDAAPTSPANGAYWIDTSQTPHELKVYSSSLKTWSPVATTYIKIEHPDLANVFSQYDGVSFSGVTNEQFLNAGTDYVIASTGYGWIVVVGIIDENFTEAGEITIARRVPEMDFITENGNRLWGCSSKNHEIYSCKLGDPTNWFCYQGIATDSYAATVGSDGDFTGIASHLGYVLFFKERCIHKLFGTRPANYQIMEVNARGVKAGAASTICQVNETLYYLSPEGIMRYDGSLPEDISSPLGVDSLEGGASGALDGKYYVSLKNSEGWGLYLFDEKAGGLWLREDGTRALYMAQDGNELYFVDEAGALWSEKGTLDPPYCDENAAEEGKISWFCETGDFLMDEPETGYMGRVQMRCMIPRKGFIRVEAMYDSDGIWRQIETVRETPLRSITVEVVPYQCDHFRLRLSGEGDVKIYSLARKIELDRGRDNG